MPSPVAVQARGLYGTVGMSVQEARDLLAYGWAKRVVEIGGLKFTVRTLTTSDMVLLQAVRDTIIAERPNMTVENFVSTDTLLKLALVLMEVNGSSDGLLSPDETRKMANDILRLSGEALKSSLEKAKNAVLQVIDKFLFELPPQVVDHVSQEYNNLVNELTEKLKSGELVKN